MSGGGGEIEGGGEDSGKRSGESSGNSQVKCNGKSDVTLMQMAMFMLAVQDN